VEVVLRYIMVSRFTGGGSLEVYPGNLDTMIYPKITSTSKP
jgi:hypothetical protein